MTNETIYLTFSTLSGWFCTIGITSGMLYSFIKYHKTKDSNKQLKSAATVLASGTLLYVLILLIGKAIIMG